jgi:predicted Zn-dependent protease with MMP-like domain
MEIFPDIDQVQQMLEEISESIPAEFFKKLNEGVVLLPQHRYHPRSREGRPLYILGEYRKSITGSHIRIYYGSFKRTMEGMDRQKIREKLEETLLHEFTHHLETLAGERGLILKDQESIKRYLEK